MNFVNIFPDTYMYSYIQRHVHGDMKLHGFSSFLEENILFLKSTIQVLNLTVSKVELFNSKIRNVVFQSIFN